jgi:hypothetical protein
MPRRRNRLKTKCQLMPIRGRQSADRPKVMGRLLTATLKRRALKSKAPQKLDEHR